MNAMLAIIGDTWRQSRQQIVFLIMCGLLLVTAITGSLLCKQVVDEDGTERVGFAWQTEESAEFLEEIWVVSYANTLVVDSGEQLDPMAAMEDPDAYEERMQAFRAAVEKKDSTSPARRATETYLTFVCSAIYAISMLLFIGASAGYFPNMLESGGVDIVVSKPIRRYQIYLGKYIGGLALFSAALVTTYFIVFVGVGLRTGEWVGSLFLVLPLQLLAAAVLYGILAAIGTISRNATLSIIVGYAFYLVVDSIIGFAIQAGQAGLFGDIGSVIAKIRWILPNFKLLKANSVASVLNMPAMDWQPFIVATAWLGLTLGLGIWKFSKSDY